MCFSLSARSRIGATSLLALSTAACASAADLPPTGGPRGGSPGSGGAAVAGNGGVGGDGSFSGSGGEVIPPGGAGGIINNTGGGDPGTGGFIPTGGMGGLPPDPDFLFGTDPNRNYVGANQICDRLSTIQCAAQNKCCGAPAMDFNTCKQTSFNACTNDLYLDAIASNPVTGFSSDAARVAFDQFEAMSKACDPNVTTFAASQTGLRAMLLGTRQSGDNCAPLIPITTQGAATALASCNLATPCLAHGTPPRWRCTAVSGPGGPCFTDLNCTDGYYCPQGDPPDFDLTCLPRNPAGTPCTLGNECQSLICKGVCANVGDPQAAFCL